jgi:endonuclease YncB( thermonuclease family)
MKKMLDRRERVKLIRDRSQDNRDAFGRLLRYVEDGRKDVGKAQVGKGWAKVVKFDGRFKRMARTAEPSAVQRRRTGASGRYAAVTSTGRSVSR